MNKYPLLLSLAIGFALTRKWYFDMPFFTALFVIFSSFFAVWIMALFFEGAVGEFLGYVGVGYPVGVVLGYLAQMAIYAKRIEKHLSLASEVFDHFRYVAFPLS